MKRPLMATPRTPGTARIGVPRSRKDAAIQLVRLEFDMSRLRRAIDQSERRSASDRAVYADKERQRQSLMRVLNATGGR
jgi:hypothetical protein